MPIPSIRVGNVDIVGLDDATVDYPWPLAELFPTAPAQAWPEFHAHYGDAFAGETGWRSAYMCYAIRSASGTTLVDTGMGPTSTALASVFGRGGQLLEQLAAVGLAPEDVDTVILGHLHPDHVGWNVQRTNGSYRLTFPRARYVVHRADWDAFHRPEVQAHFPFEFVPQTITPLESLGALDLVDSDRSLTSDIELLHTPGHTPGHMSVLISSAGERALIWGDVAVHPAQVSEPDWNVMFDMHAEQARATRQAILDRVEADGMVVAARHFPEPGFGRVIRVEGRRYWQALTVEQVDDHV